MSLIKNISLLIIFITCAGCGPNRPVGYDAPGLDELKKLCAKDAGLTIYKTVEAEGYYDSTAKAGGRLLDSDYQFYEYCNNDPSPVFPELGCRRLIKVSRDTDLCDEEYDKTLMRFDRKGYAEFREQNCIAVEKIEKPTARYSYHSDFKKWYSKNETSKFTRSDIYIKDSQTSEILGRYISYSYNVKPGHTTAKSCEIFEGDYPSYAEANLINTILKPTSKGVGHD